jgi:hypothetical protein
LKIEKLSKKVSNLKATTDDKEISETHVTEEGDLETVPPAKETVNEAVEEEFDEFADILFAAMEEDESSKQSKRVK